MVTGTRYLLKVLCLATKAQMCIKQELWPHARAPFCGFMSTGAALLSDMQARLERQTDTNAGDIELESKLSTGPQN